MSTNRRLHGPDCTSCRRSLWLHIRRLSPPTQSRKTSSKTVWVRRRLPTDVCHQTSADRRLPTYHICQQTSADRRLLAQTSAESDVCPKRQLPKQTSAERSQSRKISSKAIWVRRRRPKGTVCQHRQKRDGCAERHLPTDVCKHTPARRRLSKDVCPQTSANRRLPADACQQTPAECLQVRDVCWSQMSAEPRRLQSSLKPRSKQTPARPNQADGCRPADAGPHVCRHVPTGVCGTQTPANGRPRGPHVCRRRLWNHMGRLSPPI